MRIPFFVAGIAALLLTGLAKANELPFLDKDFACTSQADADRYKRDFNINIRSFGGNELCNSSVDTKKLLNDIELVEKGQFINNGPKNVFIRNAVPKDNYYSWMKSMTYGIRRGHDIPFATAYNSGGYFTMQDGWAKLSTLGRVGTIIHEARHTEGYSHRICHQGPYKDTRVSGCDSSVEQEGSHGIEMEYYSRVVLQGQNFHPAYQAMARLMNLGRANAFFNRHPMNLREAVFGYSKNISVLADTNTSYPVYTEDFSGLTIKRSSFGATAFNGFEGWAIDLYASSPIGVALMDAYSYFKMLFRDNNPELVDIEEFDIGDKRYLFGMDKQNNIYKFSFRKGEWSSKTLNAGGGQPNFITTAPNGDRGLFILLPNAQVLPINPERFRFEAALSQNWDPNVVQYAIDGNDLLELRVDGTVFNQSTSRTSQLFGGYPMEQMINVPLYDAFDLTGKY